MRLGLVALVLAPLLLGGCRTVSMVSSIDDVHAFLLAVRNDDQASFDRHIDQTAVIEGAIQKRCYGAGNRGEALSNCLRTTARPAPLPISAFRSIAAGFSYSAGAKPPPTGGLGFATRSRHYEFVCVHRGFEKNCPLTFGMGPTGWRVVGVEDPGAVGL